MKDNKAKDSIELSLFISRRIKEVREWSGLSQAAFARELGVSRSYLSEVEHRKAKPNINMLVGIATKFPDIRPEWLLTGVPPMLKVDEEEKLPEKEGGTIDVQGIYVALSETERALSHMEQPERTNLEAKAKLLAVMYNAYMHTYLQLLSVGDEEWSARNMAHFSCARLADDLHLLSSDGIVAIPGTYTQDPK